MPSQVRLRIACQKNSYLDINTLKSADCLLIPSRVSHSISWVGSGFPPRSKVRQTIYARNFLRSSLFWTWRSSIIYAFPSCPRIPGVLLITNAVLCPPSFSNDTFDITKSPKLQLGAVFSSFQLQLFTCSRIKSTCAPELPLPSPWSPCHHVRQALLKASQSFAPLVFKNSGSTWSSRAQDLLTCPGLGEKNPLPMNLCKISRVPRRQLASISYKPARLPTSK